MAKNKFRTGFTDTTTATDGSVLTMIGKTSFNQQNTHTVSAYKHSGSSIMTRCSAIAERPYCRVRYSFCQK